MAFWNRRPRKAAVERADRQVGGVVVGFSQRAGKSPWQDRARKFRTELGVVRFAYGLIADLASRCPLVPEMTENGRDYSPQEEPMVSAVIDRYRGEQESQADLVRNTIFHGGTIGECLQIIYDTPEAIGLVTIRDPTTVEKRGVGADGKPAYLVKNAPTGRESDGSAFKVGGAQVRRLWHPDAQWPDLADSSLHGVLKDCERYVALERAISRAAKSRLVVNGMVWMPSEAHEDTMLPDEQRTDYERSTIERDIRAMSELGYTDEEDSPATAAPLFVNWRKDYGPPTKLDFTQPLNLALLQMRSEALEAIARGLPLPAQLVINGPGHGGNRWGDWLADEHQSRIISGQLERVCADITATYLRPALSALRALGQWAGDPSRWRVGFDVTPITVHPDLSTVAIELRQLGAIGLEALLRETGFDPEQDVPSPEDLAAFTEFLVATHKGPGVPSGMPVDGSNVRQVAPRNPAPLAARLAPYPAEAHAWRS